MCSNSWYRGLLDLLVLSPDSLAGAVDLSNPNPNPNPNPIPNPNPNLNPKTRPPDPLRRRTLQREHGRVSLVRVGVSVRVRVSTGG